MISAHLRLRAKFSRWPWPKIAVYLLTNPTHPTPRAYSPRAMSTPSPSAPKPQAAPLVLWAIARAFLATFFHLFGDPADIAFQHTLKTSARTHLALWLRAGEALMRRLLHLEAEALTLPPPRPRAAHAKRFTAPLVFDADHPETWRVRFTAF